MSNQKILIYGGTFNPVHYAHYNNVKMACNLYDFDKILIIPNGLGFFKSSRDVASKKHRLRMLELAFEGIDNLEILDIEINAKKSVYTYDTIQQLKKDYPGQYYYLIGSDQALMLDKWYKIEELKQEVTFIVSARDQDVIDDKDLIVMSNQPLNYSSTSIREYYASSGIKAVDEYIRYYGLYLRSVLKHYLQEERYQHSCNVAQLAKKRAKLFGINKHKAYVAGMLHDIAKELPLQEQIDLANQCEDTFELSNPTYHGYAAVILIQEKLHLFDQDILTAIKYHTTGYYFMSELSKLIYMADMVSSDRDFEGVKDLRALLKVDLDEAFKEGFLMSYQHLIDKGIEISKELKVLKEAVERNDV